jgi:hypothetical protein
MTISRDISIAIITAIPLLMSPLMSFLFHRWGLARKVKEIELCEKRVRIIERLLTLEKHVSDSDEARNLLQIERAAILQKLGAERVRECNACETVVERLSIMRRTLLLYQQPTMKASIYRGFFWFFFSFGVLGILFMSFAVWQFGKKEDWLLPLGGLVYVAIGLLFRAIALRQLERFHLERLQTARLLSSDPRSWQPAS